MNKTLLLLACPLLLLSACSLKGGESSDSLDSTGTDSDATATDGHSSDPEVTTTGPDPTATSTSATSGEPNDGCVPQDPSGTATATTANESLGETGEGGADPDFTTTNGSASNGGTTGFGEDGGAGSTGSGEGGEAGTSDSGSATDGDPDTDGDTETGGECDPLPEMHPAPQDFNCVCDAFGEHRSCKEGEQSGTRFCDGTNWGPCVVEPECVPGTYEVCFFCDPSFGTAVAWCELQAGVPHFDFESDECNTPLVLSFDGRAVEYTSAQAEFAMTADDRCGARDWPTAATPWLAIDLDKNGSIDGGHELFGSGTRMNGIGRPGNGFVALAALDSNRDGQISAADERFAELVLWSDSDADRRSTLWELQPLTSQGIVAIDLNYDMPASTCDARGNCEVERARFTFEGPDGARSSGEVVDVRLTCQ